MKPVDQLPLPLPLPQQVKDAEQRLREFINRSAGQHLRAMRREWAKGVAA
jgi:hypothetical protein